MTVAETVPGIQPLLDDVHCGDTRELLRRIPDNSVDLVLTSPPYYGLRVYGEEVEAAWGGDPDCKHDWVVQEKRWEGSSMGEGTLRRGTRQTTGHKWCLNCQAWWGQLGMEPTVSMYVDHLMTVFREIKRILKPTGAFYLNIGDTYASSLGDHGEETAGFSKITMVLDKPPRPNHPTIGRLLIPSLVSARMVYDEGWFAPDWIIWHKRNHMPASVKGRRANSWEPIFSFVKNDKTIIWRIFRSYDEYKAGEWMDSKPRGPFREWLLREDWDEHEVEEGSETVCQHQHKAGEWVPTKPPKEFRRVWSRSRTNWLGFCYYYELDAIRVPHQTGPGRFNIRVRDAKEKRIREKWGPLASATDEEVAAYDEKIYSGKYSDPTIDAETLASPRARQMRIQQQIGDAHKGTATAGLYDPLRKSYYAEGGKNPGDVVYETDGRAPGTNVGEKGAGITHDETWRPPTRLLRDDGKNPGDVQVTHEAELGMNKKDVRYEQDHLSRPPSKENNPERAFHSKGKNPGDTLTSPPQQTGMEGHSGYVGDMGQPLVDLLKGKNPGDIIEHNGVEYIVGWRHDTPKRDLHIHGDHRATGHDMDDATGLRLWRLDGKNPGDTVTSDVDEDWAAKATEGGDTIWDPEFWDISTKPLAEIHYAVFPEELCVPPILSNCPVGGVVLDPFAGSGTVGVVAKKLRRQFILFEIKPAYCDIIKRRLGKIPDSLEKFVKN